MVKFHIPDIETKFDLNIRLIDLTLEHPEYFYDNIKIDGVYGIFGSNVLNGGRTISGFFTPKERKEKIIREYNSRRVSIIYTFTNPFVTTDIIDNFYVKEDLDIAHNAMNKVIVNSGILNRYLKSNYPNYKLISSITNKNSNNVNTFSSKEYDIHVANASLNNTDTLFNIKDKSSIEILVNSQCIRNCKFEQQHYEDVVKLATGEVNYDEAFLCPYHGGNTGINPYGLDFMKTLDVFITVEDLYNKYIPAGFNIFKINGRTFPKHDVIDYYMYYLVKPEHQDTVREELEKFA